jgi:hypothetical protein
MAILGFVHLLFKVKDNRVGVLPEEPLALRNGRGIGRAGGVVPELTAAKHALYSHPLGYYDPVGVNPLEVPILVPMKQFLEHPSLLPSDKGDFFITGPPC